MTDKKLKLSLIVLAIYMTMMALPMFLAKPVFSQGGGGGLQITPGPILLEIESGESDTFDIAVKNVLPSPVNVIVEYNDFESDGASGNPKLLIGADADKEVAFSIKNYIKGPESFSLEVGESRTLTYTLAIPEDAAPGSRHGVVRFLANAESDGAEEGVNLSASLGTIVLVDTPGNAVELLTFKDMFVRDGDGNTGSVFSTPPEHLVIKLSNEGNTFVRPYGNVTIKNWGGDVVSSYEFNQAQQDRPGLLPQSEREFSRVLEGVDGYGKYTIEASISYGDGDNIIPATISFWVIPWKIIAAVLVVLTVLIVIIVRGLQMHKKKVAKSAKTENFKTKK